MKKIVFLRNGEDFLNEVRAAMPGWEVVMALTDEQAALHLPGAEILLGWRGIAERYCLADDTSLRFIQSWSAGVDMMPLARFRELGIRLATSSGVHARPITELVFAMILSFARQLHVSVLDKHRHSWNQTEALSGALHEAHGKTIGILGAGTIGARIAHVARAFDMTVLGCRRSGAEAPGYDKMFSTAQLREFLGASDYVVNVLPLTPETHHIMDTDTFAMMKQGSHYITVGRGPTTSIPALIEALRGDRLAGAGIDVTEPEPLPADSPLWDLPNVILTPHNAGQNPFYSRRLAEIFLENLNSYVETGEPCRNLTDLERSY